MTLCCISLISPNASLFSLRVLIPKAEKPVTLALSRALSEMLVLGSVNHENAMSDLVQTGLALVIFYVEVKNR